MVEGGGGALGIAGKGTTVWRRWKGEVARDRQVLQGRHAVLGLADRVVQGRVRARTLSG